MGWRFRYCLLHATDDTIAWYENNGAAIPWTATSIIDTTLKEQPLFVADMDGDGDLI